MKQDLKIEVWLEKETGQLWEHLPTVLGYALAKVDIENTEFTSWSDWADTKQIFCFDDMPFYNPENFINLGEL